MPVLVAGTFRLKQAVYFEPGNIFFSQVDDEKVAKDKFIDVRQYLEAVACINLLVASGYLLHNGFVRSICVLKDFSETLRITNQLIYRLLDTACKDSRLKVLYNHLN